MHRITQIKKAVCFSVFLVLIFIFTLVMVFATSGPLILGTEMNANGTVEYLCLSNDCEAIR